MMDEERVEVHSMLLDFGIFEKKRRAPHSMVVLHIFFFLVKLKKSGCFKERRERRKEGFIYFLPSLLFSWSLARGGRMF
jgi:hypothetical protein